MRGHARRPAWGADRPRRPLYPPASLPACRPTPAGAGGNVFLSWHSTSQRLLAVGVGGKVLLVGVPAEGEEELEFELGADSTPGEACMGCLLLCPVRVQQCPLGSHAQVPLAGAGLELGAAVHRSLCQPAGSRADCAWSLQYPVSLSPPRVWTAAGPPGRSRHLSAALVWCDRLTAVYARRPWCRCHCAARLGRGGRDLPVLLP